MKKLLLLLLLLLLGVAALLSPPGQKHLLLPLVNRILAEKVPGHRIRLSALDAGFSSLSFDGTFDGTIRFHAEGPVEWLKRAFDLRYRAEGDRLLLQGRTLPLQLRIAGEAKGTVAAMELQGRGELAASPLKYRFRLAEGRLSDLRLETEGAKLSQLLALAGMPAYARGRLYLVAGLPSLEERSPLGRLRFRIDRGELDATLLADKGIVLPAQRSFTASGSFRLRKGLLRGSATLETPLGTLRAEKFRADPSFRIVKSDFSLSIHDLASLRSLLHAPLSGPLTAKGSFYFDRGTGRIQLLTSSGSFGGELRSFYDSGSLKLTMRGLELPRLLAVLGQKPWLRSGTLEGTIRLKDTKRLSGDFDLRATGRWNAALLPPRDYGKLASAPFILELRGKGVDGKFRGRGKYRSEPASLLLPEWRFALPAMALESDYRLKIPDLGRLGLPAGTKLRGPFALEGKLAYLGSTGSLSLEGRSGSFGGRSRLSYDGRRLTLEMKGSEPARILQMLGAPRILDGGSLDARLEMRDLRRLGGSYELRLSTALDRAYLRRQLGRDPGSSIPLKLGSHGTIRQGIVRGEGLLESKLAQLSVRKYRYRIATKSLRGSYRLKIPELARWKPLTERTYRGPLSVGGSFASTRAGLTLDGSGKQWGGIFSFRLHGRRLEARAEKLRVERLLRTLAYPKLLKGEGRVTLRYDLQHRKGTVDGRIDQARLMQTPAIQAASLLLKSDLSAILFDPVLFRAKIAGTRVDFDFDARSPKIRLRSEKGHYDLARERIDTILAIEKGRKLYKLKIRGPLSHPKVTPILTDALRERLDHAMKKHKLDKKLEKAIPKELRKALPVEDLIHSIF